MEKIRAGKQVPSARAIDHETLKRLHDFNIAFVDEEGPHKRKRKLEQPECFIEHSIWIMLLLIYLLAFLCLLCFDEVLNIKWE